MQIKPSAHGVALHDLPGGHAAQAVVQRAFKTFQTLVVQADKAQQLPGHMLEGIDTVVFLAQAYAGNIGLAYGLGGVVVHLAAQPDKAALGLRQLRIELLRILPQDGPQFDGHGLKVFNVLRSGID